MRTWMAVFMFVAGCSSDTGGMMVDGEVDADVGSIPDADPRAPDARPGTPDARPAAGPDATPAPALQSCYKSCGTVSDCVIAGSPLYDADNWTCSSGVCRWDGCNSAAECRTTFMNQAYTCKATAATGGLPTCQPTCNAPADCAQAAPIYSASHWSCDDNTCTYNGCQNAAECRTTFNDQSYTCAPTTTGVPTCQQTCNAVSDCVIAGSTLYDADNWSCRNNLCVWDGCNGDSECRATLMDQSYVCR